MSNPSRQHSKPPFYWVVSRRGKTGKYGKVEVKRKRWVLTQLSYSPQGNGRVTQGGNHGDRPPNMEDNSWSRYHQRMGGQVRPQHHFIYIHIKQE